MNDSVAVGFAALFLGRSARLKRPNLDPQFVAAAAKLGDSHRIILPRAGKIGQPAFEISDSAQVMLTQLLMVLDIELSYGAHVA
jgi:hypothetical protein